MIEKTSISPTAATLPQRLGERGFAQLARLGAVALKAAGISDAFAAVAQTGMTPDLAKEILAALEPVANGQQPGQIDPNDAKAVVAAFAKGEVSHVSFDPAQFQAFGQELQALVEAGQASSAALAYKNFHSLYQADGVKWKEGGFSYWGMNAVSSLTSRLRQALQKAGVDPDQAGIPLPGPQAM